MIGRGLKKFCIFGVMIGTRNDILREDEEDVENFGMVFGTIHSECETEDGDCADTEELIGIESRVKLVKLNADSYFKDETNVLSAMCDMFLDVCYLLRL